MNLLVDNFPCFNDRHRFEDTTVRLHKRAQILIADLWACFEGEHYGYFEDITTITMFAGESIALSLSVSASRPLSRLPNSSNAPLAWVSSIQPISGESHSAIEIYSKRPFMGDPASRLQYLVCRANSARDLEVASRVTGQCHPHRFPPLRHHKRDRSQRAGVYSSPSDEEYLVLNRSVIACQGSVWTSGHQLVVPIYSASYTCDLCHS